MTGITLSGQLLALVRESVIAAKYGATALTDAFLLAVVLPNAILLLIQNGFVLAFVPVLTYTFEIEGEERGWNLAFSVINWMLLITGLLAVIVALAANTIVTLLAPTVSFEIHALIVRMLRILVLIIVLGGVAALLAGILNVQRAYTIPTLFGLVLNVTVIAGVFLFAEQISIYALATATTVSYVFQVILFSLFLRIAPNYHFSLRFRDPGLRRILQLSWPAILTLFFQQTIVFADRSIATRLGSGNVAALNFASRLVLVLAPLLFGALSTITLPEVSRMIAEGDWTRVRQIARSLLRFMFFIAVPLATLVVVLRRPITILAFQRGAFDDVATSLTAGAMGFYAITLAAVSLREITVRLLYASHETLLPMWSGGIRMGFNLVLDIILARVMGINGIALANALAISLDVVILLYVLKRKWKLSVSLVYPLKILLASSLMFAGSTFTLELAQRIFATPASLEWVIIVGTVGILGVLIYWGICIGLNVPEAHSLYATGARRLASIRRPTTTPLQ